MHIHEPYTVFPRKLKSGKIVYYYQYRNENGERSAMYSTGCTSLRKAKIYCQQLYMNNQFGNCKEQTFEIFSKDFFNKDSTYCKWRAVSKGIPITNETLRRYETSLNYQLMPYFYKMKLNDISVNDIKEWIIWASDKWSAKTINNAQGTLNIIFEQAVEKKLMDSNPLLRISFRKVEKKKRKLLTVGEIHTIISQQWFNEAEKKAFILATITGMRIGEVCALQNCDVEKNCLKVCHTYSEHFGLGDTKTKKNRTVPIPDNFVQKSTESEWVFSVNQETPILPHSVYNAFTRMCDKLGINRKERGITLHTMRNFFISYMQGKNVPLQKIKAVVGHADESMTDWYTYWEPEMFSEVYKAQLELLKAITA